MRRGRRRRRRHYQGSRLNVDEGGRKKKVNGRVCLDCSKIGVIAPRFLSLGGEGGVLVQQFSKLRTPFSYKYFRLLQDGEEISSRYPHPTFVA